MRRHLLTLAAFAMISIAASAQDLVILHTNDTHSQLDAQRTGKYSGLGGVERRKALFDSILSKFGQEIVLRLDAGDYNQGSSYYTVYGGKLEVQVMNALGYDAVALGNHEFDDGIDALAERLKDARYETLCCNYSFRGTKLDRYVKPYTIVTKGDKRIGIIGVTTDLENMVEPYNIAGIRKLDVVKSVNRCASRLARVCDLVILLSHRGFDRTAENSVDYDTMMASKLKNVDIIIGGHSHTFMTEPYETTGADSQRIVIVQDGWGGVNVGLMVIDQL